MKTVNVGHGQNRREQLNGFKDRRQLESVAKDFESILIGQFFRLMNKTVTGDGVIKKSFERGIYEDMFHDELARAYAKRGGLNLHRIISDYLDGSSFKAARGVSLATEKKTARVDVRELNRNDFLPLREKDVGSRKVRLERKYSRIDVKNYRRDLIKKGE